MGKRRSVRLLALVLAAFASTLLAAACSSSDVDFPDDLSSVSPVSGRDAQADARPNTTDGGRDAASDASADAPVDDPNYPFNVFYESVEAGGKTQNYIVVVPKSRSAEKLPIVFGYHGDGGGAEGSKSYFQVELTTQRGAIVVYPSCPANPAWNIYGGTGNEYLAGFDAILAKVISDRGGDANKVSVFGHSSGAFFSSVLGCFRSSKIRSIGLMAGGAPFDANGTGKWDGTQLVKCPGQEAVPAFVVHDPGDPVVGYAGGKWASEYWMYANRCATGVGCNADPNDQSSAFGGACMNLNPAPDSAPVVMCSPSGVGHGFWGSFVSTFWQFSSPF